MSDDLPRPIPASAVHLCVDMQRLFAEDTPWQTPWMRRVLPVVERLCAHRPKRNWFTRFMPPSRVEDAEPGWRAYWEKWEEITLDRLGTEMAELMPELTRFVPPGRVFDKPVYAPWWDGRLRQTLMDEGADTLVISGGETDVCVLATVLGAVDLGFRVVVATDALCSSTDEVHDAVMRLYADRFGIQIETASADAILKAWA